MKYPEYTDEQRAFFRECGKKSYRARLKKYGKKGVKDLMSKAAVISNARRMKELTKKI